MNIDEKIQQAFDAKYAEIGEDAWHDTGNDKIFEYGWIACLNAQPLRVTDLTTKLRQLPRTEVMANRHAQAMLSAAAEIERYYGGMMAWKQTAETRDRQLAEAMEKRITERVEARVAGQGKRPAPIEALGNLLQAAMNTAASNGADSRSMPDEYVAIAHFLCFPDEYALPVEGAHKPKEADHG